MNTIIVYYLYSIGTNDAPRVMDNQEAMYNRGTKKRKYPIPLKSLTYILLYLFEVYKRNLDKYYTSILWKNTHLNYALCYYHRTAFNDMKSQ